MAYSVKEEYGKEVLFIVLGRLRCRKGFHGWRVMDLMEFIYLAAAGSASGNRVAGIGSLVGIGHQPCMRKEVILLITYALTNLLMNWLAILVFMEELPTCKDC